MKTTKNKPEKHTFKRSSNATTGDNITGQEYGDTDYGPAYGNREYGGITHFQNKTKVTITH